MAAPPPPDDGTGWEAGDRLFFTVGDLIAHRFHYLRTNVTFTSNQGARRALAALLATSQPGVHKVFSQSEQPLSTGERDRETRAS